MLVIVEALVVLFVFRLYPLFSMLFFGEGADSFLYANSNAILWVIVPVIGPSIFNSIRIQNGITDKIKEKVRAYIIIELILLVLYTAYIVWWALNVGFHI